LGEGEGTLKQKQKFGAVYRKNPVSVARGRSGTPDWGSRQNGIDTFMSPVVAFVHDTLEP